MTKIASLLPAIATTSTINSDNISNNNKPVASSKTVEISPNVVYQVRSKKNKKTK